MADEKSFMVVDEKDTNSLFWEMTMKEAFANSTVKCCKNGYDALDDAKGGRYHFFVASWEMQPMSGLIFMQKLRKIFKYRHAPVLIFSQVLKEEEMALAQEFGIKNYLLPPFTKERILEKVNAMFAEETNLDNTQRMLRKIEDWISEKKINEALKVINDVLKPGPNAARAYSLNGDIWAQTEHLEKAEKAYRESLKFDEKYVPAMNGLGMLYLKMKKFKEAADQFEIVNRLCPKNLDRMINLGNAYLGNGDDAKAEAMFNQVKVADVSNADASEALGKVEFQRGNLDNAARFFKESGKGEELATYFNSMGIAMVNQGKHDDAIKLYRNAMVVLPDQEKAHLLEFNIALAYKKSNRYGEATGAFARSLIAAPSYEKAYQGMALCMREAHARKQDYDKALVQKAVEVFREAQQTREEAEAEGGSAGAGKDGK
jgi:tetratricopeptide (TPR) repeat protein